MAYLEKFVDFYDFTKKDAHHEPMVYHLNTNHGAHISKYQTKTIGFKFAPVQFDLEENKLF